MNQANDVLHLIVNNLESVNKKNYENAQANRKLENKVGVLGLSVCIFSTATYFLYLEVKHLKKQVAALKQESRLIGDDTENDW